MGRGHDRFDYGRRRLPRLQRLRIFAFPRFPDDIGEPRRTGPVFKFNFPVETYAYDSRGTIGFREFPHFRSDVLWVRGCVRRSKQDERFAKPDLSVKRGRWKRVGIRTTFIGEAGEAPRRERSVQAIQVS